MARRMIRITGFGMGMLMAVGLGCGAGKKEIPAVSQIDQAVSGPVDVNGDGTIDQEDVFHLMALSHRHFKTQIRPLLDRAGGEEDRETKKRLKQALTKEEYAHFKQAVGTWHQMSDQLGANVAGLSASMEPELRLGIQKYQAYTDTMEVMLSSVVEK